MQSTGVPIVTNGNDFTLDAPETPQPVPTNITSTPTDYSNQFALNWTDNSTVETGYIIEAKAEGSNVYIPVKGVMKNVTSANNFSRLTEGTKYNFRIKASNTKSNYSAESALIQIPALCGNNNTTSCSPNPATGGPNWNIENVKISQNNIVIMQNLNSNCSTGGIGNYYASNIANLSAGATASVEVKAKADSNDGSAYNCYVKVFVDWNKNNVFDPATEKVIEKNGSNGMTESFVIPSTTPSGSYRMRIALSAANFSGTNPCSVSFGEIEDYQLAITGATLSTAEFQNSKEDIYPNPVENFLYLKSTKKYKQFNVYSAEGRLVLKGNIHENQINMSTLEKGYYIIEVSDSSGNTAKYKILKK